LKVKMFRHDFIFLSNNEKVVLDRELDKTHVEVSS